MFDSRQLFCNKIREICLSTDIMKVNGFMLIVNVMVFDIGVLGLGLKDSRVNKLQCSGGHPR